MIAEVVRTSHLILSAQEVYRLATQSIAEIDDTRRRSVNTAIKLVETQTNSYFFGLYRRNRYPTYEDACLFAPEVVAAKNYAAGDRMTCQILQQAAKYMMDNKDIPEEQKVLYISINDFRALT